MKRMMNFIGYSKLNDAAHTPVLEAIFTSLVYRATQRTSKCKTRILTGTSRSLGSVALHV